MVHEVIMPALGMAQDTGKLVNWLMKDGDQVKTGDILFEVETDKSTMEVESQADGYLSSISAVAGDDVPVGNVIALISDTPGTGEPIAAAKAEAVEPETNESAKSSQDAQPVEPLAVSQAPALPIPASGKILASPKAKRLAAEMDLNLSDLAAAGHPQPYHVSDIEVLKNLEPKAPTESFFLAFEVGNGGIRDFLDWMQADGGITLDIKHVWMSFASACLRNATGAEEVAIVIELTTLDGASSSFLNADMQRLSSMVATDEAVSSDLIVRDATGSPFTQIRLGAIKAPTMTIAETENRYLLTLEFSHGQLAHEQAIAFASDFCERMTNPLQHVI